jgi:hypothetical protein
MEIGLAAICWSWNPSPRFREKSTWLISTVYMEFLRVITNFVLVWHSQHFGVTMMVVLVGWAEFQKVTIGNITEYSPHPIFSPFPHHQWYNFYHCNSIPRLLHEWNHALCSLFLWGNESVFSHSLKMNYASFTVIIFLRFLHDVAYSSRSLFDCWVVSHLIHYMDVP